ncbi:MAG: hypothetical protein AB1781_11005 [Pseudomonadota bacterium]
MTSNWPPWLAQSLWSWTTHAEGRIKVLEADNVTAKHERRALARRLKWMERGLQAVATIGLTVLATLAPTKADQIASLILRLLRP